LKVSTVHIHDINYHIKKGKGLDLGLGFASGRDGKKKKGKEEKCRDNCNKDQIRIFSISRWAETGQEVFSIIFFLQKKNYWKNFLPGFPTGPAPATLSSPSPFFTCLPILPSYLSSLPPGYLQILTSETCLMGPVQIMLLSILQGPI
jgi:hypothetical protein